MKSIGWLLVFLGAGSLVLKLVGYEFVLLMWIDNWGAEIGWAIRGAMIVAGGVLVFFGMKSEAGATVTAEPVQPAPQPEPQQPEPQQPEPQGFEPQGFEPEMSPEKE